MREILHREIAYDVGGFSCVQKDETKESHTAEWTYVLMEHKCSNHGVELTPGGRGGGLCTLNR